MRTLGLVIACVALMNCGKKVENVPAPVNPQVTDAVTQAVVVPVAAADAGVAESVVKTDPDPKPVEVPAVQSAPESK